MATAPPIDLRSDTVTRPTPAMREAMARAEVGDDVYGEDPTVRRLEERVAALLGHEAGLFAASGTMANQCAMGALARHGDEVIGEARSHLLEHEGGAVAALWGAQPRALHGERGVLLAADVEAALRPDDPHYPRSRVVAIENTHNAAGGAVWPVERVRDLARLAAARGLALYLDGARLLNAAVAAGQPARAWAEAATMASLCLSKGLGAPAGSVVCGPAALVHEARRVRKRLGGGMRQAGILAAAGLHALDHHVARLADDHARARRLGEALAALPGWTLPYGVETNLVFVRPPRPAAEVVARLRGDGVLAGAAGPDLVRFATHLDVDDAALEEALRRLERVFGRGSGRG